MHWSKFCGLWKLKTLLSARTSEKYQAWPDLSWRKYFTFFLQVKVQAVAAPTDNPPSCFLLLTSARVPSTCSSSGFVASTGCDFEAFPASARVPVLSRLDSPKLQPATCSSSRGAIGGLTLPHQRLLITDRLSATAVKSSKTWSRELHHVMHPAPLVRTRESPLGWKRVGLGKKCTLETSMDGCTAYSPSVVMHSFLERDTKWWKAHAAWPHRAAFPRVGHMWSTPMSTVNFFFSLWIKEQHVIIGGYLGGKYY